MAHKKGQGSSRNGRDSNSQRLGVKVFGGQAVRGGGDHPPPARHALEARPERGAGAGSLAVRPRGRLRPLRGPRHARRARERGAGRELARSAPRLGRAAADVRRPGQDLRQGRRRRQRLRELPPRGPRAARRPGRRRRGPRRRRGARRRLAPEHAACPALPAPSTAPSAAGTAARETAPGTTAPSGPAVRAARHVGARRGDRRAARRGAARRGPPRGRARRAGRARQPLLPLEPQPRPARGRARRGGRGALAAARPAS